MADLDLDPLIQYRASPICLSSGNPFLKQLNFSTLHKDPKL